MEFYCGLMGTTYKGVGVAWWERRHLVLVVLVVVVVLVLVLLVLVLLVRLMVQLLVLLRVLVRLLVLQLVVAVVVVVALALVLVGRVLAARLCQPRWFIMTCVIRLTHSACMACAAYVIRVPRRVTRVTRVACVACGPSRHHTCPLVRTNLSVLTTCIICCATCMRNHRIIIGNVAEIYIYIYSSVTCPVSCLCDVADAVLCRQDMQVAE